MKLVKMTYKNSDGSVIEKEIEEILVSTYKSMGWDLKKEPKSFKTESSFENSKRLNK